MLADPEPPDDDDAEFQAELFEVFRRLGWAPEDLRDKDAAARYAEWLKTWGEEPRTEPADDPQRRR